MKKKSVRMQTNQIDEWKKKQQRRNLILLCLFSILLLFSFLCNILFGATNVSLSGFLDALRSGNHSSYAYRIIFYVRLPRALAALLSGMALAVSGVIIQAVLGNPLAAPNIIGVNAGSGFAALLIIGIFPQALSIMPFAAIAGALMTSLLIYLIAARTGAGKVTITLAGIAISSILTAGMNTIKTIYPDSLYNSSSFLIGGFSGIGFKNISFTWILIAIGICLALMLAQKIDILSLGDVSAKSLGINIGFLRFVLIMIASILAGSAVSFSGLLGFVGLIVPHIARRLVGNRHIMLIPVSILCGASFVLLCDLISRLLFAPYELPVGIIMSLIGGPFFLFLLLQKKGGLQI